MCSVPQPQVRPVYTAGYYYQLFAYFNNTPMEVEGDGVTYNFVGSQDVTAAWYARENHAATRCLPRSNRCDRDWLTAWPTACDLIPSTSRHLWLRLLPYLRVAAPRRKLRN